MRHKQQNLLSRFLDIAPHEWARVIYSFFLKFFAHTGHVIGHAMIIAVVAMRLGVEMLPFLFMVMAALTILGTILFARIRKILKPSYSIILLSALTALSLLVARILFEYNMDLFYVFILIAGSMIFPQLTIMSGLIIEDRFTPIESKRTFPVIESADLFAALLGGGLVTVLSSSSIQFEIVDMTYVWAFLIFATLLVQIIQNIIDDRVPKISKIKEKIKFSILDDIVTTFKSIKNENFLMYLSTSIFLLMMTMPMFEFQYTRALADGSHGEEDLIHGLGLYTLVFAVVGIFIELLMAGKLARSLGVVRSLLIHPILTLLPVAGMTIGFSTVSAISSKFVFDITDLFSRNSYFSSFYVLPEKLRDRAKAAMEGWVRPAGLLFGTLILFLFEYYHSYSYIPVFILLILLLSIFYGYKMKNAYTSMAIKNLKSAGLIEKYNAIEILSEQGHRDGCDHLSKNLIFHKKNKEIRKKIISTLGEIDDKDSIAIILDYLEDEDVSVRLAALKSLNKQSALSTDFKTEIFTRFRIFDSLTSLFQSKSLDKYSNKLKSAIIYTFMRLKNPEIVPFLMNLLSSDDDKLKEDAIYVIGSFADPNIAHYIKPFLSSDNPRLKAAAVTALWQFSKYRLDLIAPQLQLLSSHDPKIVRATIHMLGEIRAKQEEVKLLKYLEHDDIEIMEEAAIALAKLGNKAAVQPLIHLLLDDGESSDRIRDHFARLDDDIRKKIDKSVNHEISHRISTMIMDHNGDISLMTQKSFEKLCRFYKLIGEEKEVIKLLDIREA